MIISRSFILNVDNLLVIFAVQSKIIWIIEKVQVFWRQWFYFQGLSYLLPGLKVGQVPKSAHHLSDRTNVGLNEMKDVATHSKCLKRPVAGTNLLHSTQKKRSFSRTRKCQIPVIFLRLSTENQQKCFVEFCYEYLSFQLRWKYFLVNKMLLLQILF